MTSSWSRKKILMYISYLLLCNWIQLNKNRFTCANSVWNQTIWLQFETFLSVSFSYELVNMLQAHCMWINTALAAFEGIQWHLQGSTVGILNHGTMFVCAQCNTGYLGAYLVWVLCSLRGVSTVVYCVLRYLCNTIYLDVCSVRRRRVFISCDVEVHWWIQGQDTRVVFVCCTFWGFYRARALYLDV